jgi:hypothetical protein
LGSLRRISRNQQDAQLEELRTSSQTSFFIFFEMAWICFQMPLSIGSLVFDTTFLLT